ncbi:MAG: redoxin family protein, partial [Candidatus Micrarchaeota archaeon]|nr:redoxin family protein [Candidatus Micrarchaeota archaeon]
MIYQKAPELVGISGYINTGGKPVTIGQFKGKDVVLVDFWTYSCINCIRTIPYVESWYRKYKDEGLVIIGVSTPEFAFE